MRSVAILAVLLFLFSFSFVVPLSSADDPPDVFSNSLFVISGSSLISPSDHICLDDSYFTIIHSYKYISVKYTHRNGSVIFERSKQIGSFLTLHVVDDAVLTIMSDSGALLWRSAMHPATFDNILKYRLGARSSDPKLARWNTFFGLLLGGAAGACFVGFVVVPYLRHKTEELL